MRVSTISTYLNGLSAMQRLQSALDHTQRQISTGRRILLPSDDPIGSSRALEFRESIARLGQFDRNAGIAQNQLAQEESVLGSINSVLQRVRELALQANNATQSNETRELIAIEMREQLENLMQFANQKDGNGRYLFSGNLEDVQPVSRMGMSFAYNGDQGQRLVQIGEGRQIADGDSGADIFFRIRAGNGVFTSTPSTSNTGTGIVGQSSVVDPSIWDQGTYTVRFIDPANYEVLDSGGAVIASNAYQSGDRIAFQGVEFSLTGQPATADEFAIAPSPYQDMFMTIDKLATAIEQPIVGDVSRAEMTNAINASLQNIDQALGSVLNIRTKVGSRLAVIENQVDNNAALTLTIQETLSSVEDLDYAEALSRLSQEVTLLEAAQQSFVRTQQLSLFNFL